MPRRNRCIVPDVPCHVTQRGVDRRETFSADEDQATYLTLLRQNLADAEVNLLAWCLMSNHLHLVAIPRREDSMAVLLRRVHGRYAQYYNARQGRTGHLWQNRYFACSLGPSHLWAALAYVEGNPVRAGLVQRASDYRWSSAVAHLAGEDPTRTVDMDWWQREYDGASWAQTLRDGSFEPAGVLRRCTYAGRPFGDDDFVHEISLRFGRHWVRGRPSKEQGSDASGWDSSGHLALSTDAGHA